MKTRKEVQAKLLVFAALLSALCMWAAAVSGQTIEGPDKVDAGKPAWYSITGVPPGSLAAWIPDSGANPELQAGPPHICDGHAMLCALKPGTRSIVAVIAVVDETGRLKGLVPVTKLIEVGGEAPSPDPFPNPYPVPPADWKAAVKPILSTGPPRPYALDRAERFSRLAQNVRQGGAQTVRDLWGLLAAEKAEGSHPAAKTAVAAVLEKQLGLEDGPLDAAAADQTLMAIAWALVEASR